MLIDRRGVARSRGEGVARAYERSRGATVTDVSQGHSNELRMVLRELGCEAPKPPSADLISRLDVEVRIIEVKSRGGYGPITGVPERELDTMRAAGECSWLYVVFNVTQPGPYELVVIQDPGRSLVWTETRPAERAPDQPRGVRHEAAFACDYEQIIGLGMPIGLHRVEGLPPKDALP